MSNEEQHEMLCAILLKLVPILDCDELSLLAHCCGVSVNDFYPVSECKSSDIERLPSCNLSGGDG